MTGPELVAWRRQRGQSREWLAQMLEVAVATIRNWETGRRPCPANLWRLLRDLDEHELRSAGARDPAALATDRP